MTTKWKGSNTELVDYILSRMIWDARRPKGGGFDRKEWNNVKDDIVTKMRNDEW